MAAVTFVRSTAGSTTTSATLTLTVTAPTVGDYLVVSVFGTTSNSTGPLNADLSTATVTDNATGGTNTYTRQTALYNNTVDSVSNFDSAGIAVFLAPVSRTNAGTFTVTITTSINTTANNGYSVGAVVSEWSGVAGSEGFSTLNALITNPHGYSAYPTLTATLPGDALVTSQVSSGDTAAAFTQGLGITSVFSSSGTSVEYVSVTNARQVNGTFLFSPVNDPSGGTTFVGIALLLKSTNTAVASVAGHNVEFSPREFPLQAYDAWNGFPRPPATYNGLMFNRTAAAAPATVPILLQGKDFQNPIVRPPPVYVPPDVLTVRKISAPFNQTDWQNPVVSRASAVVHAFAGSVLTLLAVTATPVPFTLRAKDLPNPITRIAAQQDVGSNNTIRQVAPPVPFKPVDLPNPITRVSPLPVPPDFLTIQKIAAPFGQTDWANPVTRTAAQQDPGANYTLQQKAPVLAPPFKPVDLPNPITRLSPLPDSPDFMRYLAVPGPFKQSDWLNPITRIYPQPDVLPNTTIRQVAPVLAPFVPADLPNPLTRIAAQPIPPDFLTIRSISAPFNQTDFPNPVTRLSAQPVPPDFLTIRSISAPFNQTDFPNPVTRIAAQPVPPDFLTLQILSPPTRMTDWPNPTTRVPPQHEVGANYTLRQIAPAAPTPFKPADLLNPFVRVAAQQDVGANYTLRQVIAPTPFNQTDWPNPQFRAPRGITFDPAYLQPPPLVIVLVTGVSGFGTIGQVSIQITQLWNPVNDSQTPNWGVLPDTQTPNWIPVVDAQTPGWTVVSDPQTPNWTSVSVAPTTAWTTISDAQTPNWVAVNDTQTSNWVAVTNSQTPNWAAVGDTQTPNWSAVNSTAPQYLLLENGNRIQLENSSGDITLEGSQWTSVNDGQTPNWK